jgi:nucleoid DNA-binding protein
MIPGDVKKNDGLSEEIAERLSIGVPEARHLLCAFSRGLAGELLATGNISLGGVGTFTVAYVPSEKKTGASGIIYTSPRNRLVFDPKVSGRDDSRRIVLQGISPGDGDAERFRKAFCGVLGCAVRQKRDIRLKGFGTFANDGGNYTFFPERSFEELLNREYLNLDEVVLPIRDASGNGTGGRKNMRPFLIAGFLLSAGILFGLFYLPGVPDLREYGHAAGQPEKVISPTASVEAAPKPAAESSADEADGVREETASADSLALVKGDFTIVLATFRKAEKAAGEADRFRAGGLPVFVWPASGEGIQYFRLATGKFSTAGGAAEALKHLPPGTDTGNACIQKVIKAIVLHGEQAK